MSPLQVMLAVSGIGGRLNAAGPDKLKMLLPVDCPPELKEAIRQNKSALLALLFGPPFVIVRSELVPSETFFWTVSEAGREMLIAHGASHGSVYTYGELDTVSRVNPDPNHLHQLCHAKRLFDGRIRPPKTS